jgi:hypothetical protein
MTKDEWLKLVRDRREEAMLLPHRAVNILFELILTLGEIVFDLNTNETEPSFPGPCSPRDARDEIEGEAVAPTDHTYTYCPVSWKHGHAPILCCTRPIHTTGDHAVGKGGMIVARWPMAVGPAAQCRVDECKKAVCDQSKALCAEHFGEGA